MTDVKRLLAEAQSRWYVGAMNDALFIINRPPRPSTDDVWPDRPDGPTVILPTHPLTHSEVNGIVDAHNEAVNHLPDYLAAVEALERVETKMAEWERATKEAGVFRDSDPDAQMGRWVRDEARAALARLRDKVTA